MVTVRRHICKCWGW